MMSKENTNVTLELTYIKVLLKDSEFSNTQKLNIARRILQEKIKEVNKMIDIKKVVVYKNLSSADMRFFLAAGYEPIRGRVLKLIDGYYIFDEEEDDYVLISEVN